MAPNFFMAASLSELAQLSGMVRSMMMVESTGASAFFRDGRGRCGIDLDLADPLFPGRVAASTAARASAGVAAAFAAACAAASAACLRSSGGV